MAGALLVAASGAAWSQAGSGAPLVSPGESLPPRFVLCQREVGTVQGERQALMRSCLARRLEGERVVQRSCKRQASAVKGVQARHQAQAACERQALSVASTELPRGPAPAPRAAPTATAEIKRPVPSPLVPVRTAPRMPAAGEN